MLEPFLSFISFQGVLEELQTKPQDYRTKKMSSLCCVSSYLDLGGGGGGGGRGDM